jgi:metallo-beta-lactamase class B
VDAVEAAQQAAKTAAGFEFLGTLARTCLLPPSRSEDFRDIPAPYVTDPGKAPPRASWYADPAKVFDNLYFVGGKVHSSWALTTREGIILLDTIYPYNSEELIVGGMKKLGLDPKDIKYVVVSHAHQDHIGGAEMLQKRYGAKVVMSAPDWALVEKVPDRFRTMAPKRDIVATDGMKLTLGDETMTLYLTPGHTEGTISTIFPVRDGGTRHVVATWGGTLFNFGPNRPRLQSYADQAIRFRDIATRAKADVIMANHTEYDGSKTKLPAVAARKKGEQHPYVVGTDAVRRYLTTVNECAQAALVIVPPAAAQ